MGKIIIELEDAEESGLDIKVVTSEDSVPDDNSYKVLEYLLDVLDQHSGKIEVVDGDGSEVKKKLLN